MTTAEDLEARYRVHPGTPITEAELEEARRIARACASWARIMSDYLEPFRDPRTGLFPTPWHVPAQERDKYADAIDNVGTWKRQAHYTARRLAGADQHECAEKQGSVAHDLVCQRERIAQLRQKAVVIDQELAKIVGLLGL